MTDAPRVFIVDDHPLVRIGLRELFEESPDFAVCGDAETAAEALRAAERLKPALLTVDLGLEGQGGLELISLLHRRHSTLRMLVVSVWDERIYAARALKAGAHGYVTKGRPPETVLEAARQVLAGETYVSEAVREAWQESAGPQPAGLHAAGESPGDLHADPAAASNGWPEDAPSEDCPGGEPAAGEPAAGGAAALDGLTNREVEIFLLIGQGHAPRSIAERLHLSVSTVESHRQHLKEKLQLDSSAMLRRYATDWVRSHL